MFIVTARQSNLVRQALLQEFAVETEFFLREHFGPRTISIASEDIHRAVFMAVAIGARYGISRAADIQIYLACASVCGLYMFEDPRCLWLVEERARGLTSRSYVDLDRWAGAIADALDSNFFSYNSLEHIEEAIMFADEGFKERQDLRDVLLRLNPSRSEMGSSSRMTDFLLYASRLASKNAFTECEKWRFVLLCWMLGIRFIDDPLCRIVHESIRQLSVERWSSGRE